MARPERLLMAESNRTIIVRNEAMEFQGQFGSSFASDGVSYNSLISELGITAIIQTRTDLLNPSQLQCGVDRHHRLGQTPRTCISATMADVILNSDDRDNSPDRITWDGVMDSCVGK
jgi:hypothetical protein